MRIAGVLTVCCIGFGGTGAAGAQAWGSAQAPSLIGRPSQDAPDACAALPLELRLRCHGGPTATAGEIGAPYGAAPVPRDGTVWDATSPRDRPSPQWQASSEARCDDERNLPGHARLGE